MIDVRPTGHIKILNSIARLYELVTEMREVIKDLHEVRVEVKIGSYQSFEPLSKAAQISVYLSPGCELIDRYGAVQSGP